MPLFDLRDKSDLAKLDELAPFKVLSVMLHPDDVAGRERFMATIAQETGVIESRRSPLSLKEATKNLRRHNGRGRQAGFLMLTSIQLHRNGFAPSMSNAIKIIQHELPPWTSEDEMNFRVADNYKHLPRARRILLKTASEFRRVAHLWAAFGHSEEHECPKTPQRRDIWIGSNETLPAFLGYSEAFAKMHGDIQIKQKNQWPASAIKKTWRFKIPPELVIRPQLDADPIPDEWRDVITSTNSITN